MSCHQVGSGKELYLLSVLPPLIILFLLSMFFMISYYKPPAQRNQNSEIFRNQKPGSCARIQIEQKSINSSESYLIKLLL